MMARNRNFIRMLIPAIMFFVSALGMRADESRLLHDSIADPSIYPGTMRDYSVYLPEHADSELALLLCFDGDVFASKEAIDSLTRCGAMPPTVAVFLNPGVVRDSEGNVVRYNRSNEFDAMTADMASFIAAELLPRVKRKLAECGMGLSDNPDLHAVAGASSGGIAAFTLAWQRPDLFRRVYCSVGTFVAMRGGDTYPAIVRKTDPKPLRIFLHDGRNDAWNPLFGHWFEYNQLMESALRFAGYDVAHAWDDGGHSIRGGIREFPAAMTWLWHDWREPLAAHRSSNDMLQSVTIDGEDWQIASESVSFPDRSRVRTANGRTYGSKHGPSISISPDNRTLVEAEAGSDWLWASIIGADGKPTMRQRFYWLHNVEHRADTSARQMAFDTDGNLYVATNMGIQVCDQNGRVRAILPLPGGVIPEAITLQGNLLYARSGATVYARRLKSMGYNPPSPPVSVKSQGQG